jgi:uncharacterized membrane protein
LVYIHWFLWFIIYSFVGWLYETVLCSIRERKLINRGFLNGPFCPVYGFGAIIVLLVLGGRSDNVIELFLAAALLTCTLEYITSYLLEKLFHTKWWDYSNRHYNLNGRVCLEGALIFGLMSVLAIQYVHPFVSGLTGRLPVTALILASALIFSGIAIDTVITVNHIVTLNGRLGEIQCAINAFIEKYMTRAGELKDSLVESFEQSEFYDDRIKLLFRLNRFQNSRLIRAFPKLRSLKYEDAMKKLKESHLRIRERDK